MKQQEFLRKKKIEFNNKLWGKKNGNRIFPHSKAKIEAESFFYRSLIEAIGFGKKV